MTERMIFISRFGGETDPDERNDAAGSVSEIVDGIGRDRNQMKEQSDDEFHRGNQEIGQDSEKTRQNPVFPPYISVFDVLIIFDKDTCEKIDHTLTPLSPYNAYYKTFSVIR